MKRPSLQLLATVAALLAPLAASANIIPLLNGVSTTGPAFTWTYNLQLAADQDARSGELPAGPSVASDELSYGSFLTIFDFAGYVADSCTSPSGWVCLVRNVGFTPSDVTPTDDAGIVNLTWQYADGAVISGQPDGVGLGLFTAQSAFNQVELTSYAGRGFKNSGQSSGTVAANVGLVGAPVGTAIPEPGSLALASVALLLLGGGLRRRRKAA